MRKESIGHEGIRATMSFRVTVLLALVSACLLGAFCGCAPKVADEGTDGGEFYIYLSPANIYEGTMSFNYTELHELSGDNERPKEEVIQLGLEGFVVSDARIVHHGRNLPEGIPLNEIEEVETQIDIDDNGALPEGYEYYFVTFTVTNEYHENEKDFYLGGTSIFVVADDYRIVTPSLAYYLNGWDFTSPSQDFGIEELKIGEAKTFTVGYVLKQEHIKEGSLYFVPDTSIAQEIDASVTTFRAMKLS
jgi:hypothetical protein